jgi:hypothetical protein
MAAAYPTWNTEYEEVFAPIHLESCSITVLILQMPKVQDMLVQICKNE